MKIYINENYEIKAINSTNDDSLTEIEIDKNLALELFIINQKRN